MTKSKTVYPKLRDKRTFILRRDDVSRTVGSSVTVPDETLTIKEIMEKHTRGMNIADNLFRRPIYHDGDHDSEDVESLSRLDLSDRSEKLSELRDRNAAKKADVQSIYDDAIVRKKAKADKALDDAKTKNDNEAKTKADAAGDRTKDDTTNKKP